MGKNSRADGRKSSNYCSSVVTSMFVAFCLFGVWVLRASFVEPIRDADLPSIGIKASLKLKTENDLRQFRDSFSGLAEATLTSSSTDETKSKEQSHQKISEEESEDTPGESKEQTLVEESSGGTTEPDEIYRTDVENDGHAKKDEVEANMGESDSKEEVSNWGEYETKQKSEDDSSEKKLEGNITVIKVESKTEEKVEQSEEKVSKENSENSNEVFPSGLHSEILNEMTTENGAWSTQAVESKNEKESLESSLSKDQSEHGWKVCNVTAGADYIPCLDNWKVIKRLRNTMHYEHRERHCPDEAPICLVSLPKGYKRPIKWPKSRDKIWYSNVPNTKLAEIKGHQNWVKVTGEYLMFPGGGTQFRHGATRYIDFIQDAHPAIAWGKRSRVILDVGCGVASFGGYLYEKDVLAMSFAPKDEHEAQVQFALERGIPAISAVMGTKRLPFPSMVFDIVHCARCRVPWHIEGGKLLLELNRVLRPGGYFVWSATPVYQKLAEDVGIWKAMAKLTKSMCWDLVVIEKDRVNGVGAAIYRKPTSNQCYQERSKNKPALCNDSDDPNAAWNVPLQACMHKVPVNKSERGSQWPEKWPLRVEQPPYWLKSYQVGVYGKAAPEDFIADYKHWTHVVSKSYLNGIGISWSTVRNVMDMRAVYGGFAAALKDLKVWVMNVVPVDSPDTLPIIYERGLFGLYHNWCESFSTYPRSYDLLHADHLFSNLKKRCSLVAVVVEVDRILRPEGKLIVRDDVDTMHELEGILRSLQWKVQQTYSEGNAGLLCAKKTMWRPIEAETIMSNIA